jgi:hypothetical protein
MIHLVAESDADGRFQFSALPPGTYALKSDHSGYFGHAARRPIVLADDERMSGAEVRLVPQAVITGRVLDEDGEPSPGTLVLVFKQGYRGGRRVWHRFNLITATNNGGYSMEELSTKTNGGGDYRIEHLPAGRYLVLAMTDRPVVDNRYRDIDSPDHPRMVNVPGYYPNAAEQQMASPVAVAAGSEVQGINIRISRAPAYHVSGRLTGLPATFKDGVVINLIGSDGALDARTTEASPPDYKFDFGVPLGEYVLSVKSGDGQFFATASVSVRSTVSNLTVPMGARSAVSGHITLAEENTGIRLEGIGLYLLEDTGNGSGWEFSDAAGNFAFIKRMPPSHYTLQIFPKAFPLGC